MQNKELEEQAQDELEPVHLHRVQNPQPDVEGQVVRPSWVAGDAHHHSGVDGFGGKPVEAEDDTESEGKA